MGGVPCYEQLQLLVKVAALEVNVPGSNSCQDGNQRLCEEDNIKNRDTTENSRATFWRIRAHLACKTPGRTSALLCFCKLDVTSFFRCCCSGFTSSHFLPSALFGLLGRSMRNPKCSIHMTVLLIPFHNIPNFKFCIQHLPFFDFQVSQSDTKSWCQPTVFHSLAEASSLEESWEQRPTWESDPLI